VKHCIVDHCVPEAQLIGNTALVTRRLGELPVETTGFVGRERELAELAALLSPAQTGPTQLGPGQPGSARLVTVTGPGGVGKTRLALRVAAQLARQFTQGVCLVELSGLRDPELLANTVASCLGLGEASGRSQLDAVIEYLHDREQLLILDTCEHLVDACAMLADVLLRTTSGVTVLATSRQPLDVPGEFACAISPLPAAGAAVELFTQLAATVVPGFAVTSANRADVIRLCQRLDGVPLALELAAVRLRALPLEQLTERLEDRFRLLTGGRRATLAHHQTLYAATEWSYDLCTPAEQLLWARLSVFAGSFDIAAAEEVCGDYWLPSADVLTTLIGLVDKSVVSRADSGGTDRYRLLDTIREFGAERLADRQDAEAVRERHVARYVALAEQFAAHFNDDQLARFRALRHEHANLRAAIESSLAAPGGQTQAARLVTALFGYWPIAGLAREGNYWTGKVLERFPDPSAERALLLVARCYLVVSGAAAAGREGVALAEELGEPLIAARGYLALHLALAANGEVAAAAKAGAAAAERMAELGDDIGLLCLDAQMSQMYAVGGQADLALSRCATGLARAVAAGGELWSASYMHYTSGLALFQQDEFASSAAAEYRALALKSELGDTMGIAHCLEVLAWLAARQQRYDRSAWLLGAAGELWRRTGRRVSGNPVLEEFHQRAAAAARAALGPDRYAIRHERGAGYPLDELITAAASDADDLGRTAAERAAAGAQAPYGPLTSREHEIALLVAAGLSNREVAHRLVISKRTVDAHIEHIFTKLGVTSRVQLATWLTSDGGTPCL
jgi:predicted ATPase/DNA-binding CsgD family transcriptional regulator